MAGRQKRELVSTRRFERRAARYVGRHRQRQDGVANALRLLAEDMFDPRLKSHALGGEMKGRYACSCGYDCRIVYSIETDPKTKTEKILLLDVGTHDAVVLTRKLRFLVSHPTKDNPSPIHYEQRRSQQRSDCP
ncbi:MAG TPA: type II toxin-antitoxin system YafQ family toxin [Verrucomicrobiae bacterium]|nr:type II toxin-antitoxin system YafQ family toxin [Verrucomicrobiae bacterium]